jgi:CBS domain-containing protein
MKDKVVSISADDTLRIVGEIMELGHVRHLPVVRQGTLVGVVSQRDLLRASLSNVMGLPRDEQSRFLEGVRISEVMSAPPISVPPETSIQDAAGVMAEKKIGCLPVVSNAKLPRRLTETDILRYFAARACRGRPAARPATPRGSSSGPAGSAR